jgi:hypothetical protein
VSTGTTTSTAAAGSADRQAKRNEVSRADRFFPFRLHPFVFRVGRAEEQRNHRTPRFVRAHDFPGELIGCGRARRDDENEALSRHDRLACPKEFDRLRLSQTVKALLALGYRILPA